MSNVTGWVDNRTEAHKNLGQALTVVDNLLSYVKDGKGKPSEAERALFAAAVVFTYGIWENFVEQLAIEAAKNLSKDIAPEKVPDQVRKSLEKKSAWELTVSPGWRALWAAHVSVQAVGDDDEKFGMNTAKSGQVKNLFMQAGVSAPFQTLEATVVPSHLVLDKKTIEGAIDSLVALRGEIVHTGKVPASLRKSHVRAWRKFVQSAADGIDNACRDQCKTLMP